VKRGAFAFGGIAIPAAVGKLLVEEAAREFFIWVAEVAAEREDGAVDAGFYLTFEEWIGAVFCWAEVPIAGSAVSTPGCFEEGDRVFDGGIGGVDDGCSQEL